MAALLKTQDAVLAKLPELRIDRIDGRGLRIFGLLNFYFYLLKIARLPSPRSPHPVTSPISASGICRLPASPRNWRELGRASCRERGWQSGNISGGVVQ